MLSAPIIAWTSLWVRSGLILIAAALVVRFAGRRISATHRHQLLALAFVLVAAWPILSAVVPQWSPPWLGSPSGYVVTVTQTARFLAGPPQASHQHNWILWLWAAGVCISLCPFLLSYARVRNLMVAADVVAEESWTNLLRQECQRLHLTRIPVLLRHHRSPVPLTFGVWRPCILLPRDSTSWTPQRTRMVLVHELTHIRRNDLLWQMFAKVVSAVWWFQPLCALNSRLLRHESELACDAQVVQCGIRSSDYASELLQIAQEFRTSHLLPSVAIPMTQSRGLGQRIEAVLNAHSLPSGRAPVLIFLLLSCLACSVSAVTLFPTQDDFEGGHPMKKRLISGLLVSAGLVTTSAGVAATPLQNVSNSGTTTSASDSDAQQKVVKPIRVPGESEQSKLVKKVNPVYPVAAKQAGIQGEVRLDVTISKEGVPVDIQVLSSPNEDLTQSAIDAVHQWRYSSTLLNGQPVAVIAEVHVNYTLAK